MGNSVLQLVMNYFLNDSLLLLLINLVIGFCLSLLLCVQFQWFSKGRTQFKDLYYVMPLILMSTILIISIIKSSLALSLGLVGALSIVRFRTPIKEPEELVYLFLAIAVGVGLGAEETILTTVGFFTILILMTLYQWRSYKKYYQKNVILTLRQTVIDQDAQEASLDWIEGLKEILGEVTTEFDLRRIDMMSDMTEVMISSKLDNFEKLTQLIHAIKNLKPSLDITYVEQQYLPVI